MHGPRLEFKQSFLCYHGVSIRLNEYLFFPSQWKVELSALIFALKNHEYLWSLGAGKCDVGKTTIHKLAIYYECSRMCCLYTLFGMICYLFSTCKVHWHDPYIMFRLRYKCFAFLGSLINRNAMKRNIDICLL